jgi:hypothetical protein
MANANELRLEEYRLQHAGVSLGSSRGENAEAMANSNSSEQSEERGHDGEVPQIPAGEWTDECATLSGGEGELRGEIMGNAIVHGYSTSEISGSTSQSEAEGRLQESEGGSSSVGDSEHDGLLTKSILRSDETTSNSRRTEESNQARQSSGADRPSDVSSLQGCTSGSESVGDSEGWSNGQQPTEQQGRHPAGGSGEESGTDNELSQTQPTLGRDVDGATNRVDDAELFVTSDNRTDELRLLGNGVVPATATRAFLVLMDQLLNETP